MWHLTTRLYEMQKVPKKIAPINWAYLKKHHTCLVSKIYFKTFFYRGLIRSWPLKTLTRDIAYTISYIKLKSRAKTIWERLHTVKIDSSFEYATLLSSPRRWWKSVAISNLELFLSEWNCSYIVLALDNIHYKGYAYTQMT